MELEPSQVLANLQVVIRNNEELFDTVETVSVRPAVMMIRGEPDYTKPFIDVRTLNPASVRSKVPTRLEGYDVRVVPGTIDEQVAHLIATKDLSDEEKSRAWREGFGAIVVEARDYSRLTYERISPTELLAVNEMMDLSLSVSPDAGWQDLQNFLGPAGDEWSIAMFDFTAPHIIDALEFSAGQTGTIKMVLDRKLALPTAAQIARNPDTPKANDKAEIDTVARYRDRLGERFSFTWASTGADSNFASAYHIKVAVRNGSAFWLSSGNWQSSNQPNNEALSVALSEGMLTPDAQKAFTQYNREWHVIVRNEKLARIFQTYIDYDFTNAIGSPGPDGTGGTDEGLLLIPLSGVQDADDLELLQPEGPDAGTAEAARRPAELFPPLVLTNRKVKVQPILTPDNYCDYVAPLIEEAQERVWFQNQSLALAIEMSPGYQRLLVALKRKTWDLGDGCRIIFRTLFRSKTIDALRKLDDFGFNMDAVRVMQNCHTKGILVDSKYTLLGSHNWTNEGTTYNRDASLLFEDGEIAHYFEAIFQHDWENLAYSLEPTPESLPVVGLQNQAAPSGFAHTGLDPRVDSSDE